MAQSSSDDEILEGFLCPICKADLQSANQLISHFKSRHQEDQDVLTSLKGIIGIAKKKIEESDLRETFDRSLKFNTSDVSYFYEPQEIGLTRSKTDYYKAVRSAKLERHAAETNKLLIRLDKLVSNLPSEPNLRKLYEQEIVPWLDGSSVKLCPGCAKSFNFARRQHHCRLCGSILCNDCSIFLDLNIAKQMTDPSWEVNKPANLVETPDKNGLRLCIHCYGLIELRKQMQDSRNSKTVLMTGYEQMRSLMDQARPSVAMYDKMCNSLYNGEATYHLSDLNSLRGRIGKLAEGIDLLSKQIAALPVRQPGSKEQKLQLSIRQAATHFIKEELLSLKRLPSEAEITDIRQKRLERAERQLELERRMQEERVLVAGLPSTSRYNDKIESSFNSSQDGEENPLLEQINIIRGYIKEARQEMRFEEVAILEANLKELKKEYQLQMLKTPT